MKKRYITSLLVIGAMTFGALIGCTPNNPPQPSASSSNGGGADSTSGGGAADSSADSSYNPTSSSSADQPVQFNFSVSLMSGGTTINKGQTDTIEITESNNDGTARQYSYSSSNSELASVNENGVITAKSKGTVRITVTERTAGLRRVMEIEITDAVLASGGYNYASLAGEEAVNTRTEILGKLEKYAMDNHLTGITLFENGGYVKYHERVTLPTTNYITGYGFGLLSEGSVNADLATEENPAYKRYLHSASSSDPKMINARNDTGSQVSDLEGYITGSFWGTKMNATKDQYVWYPVLAKDKVTFNGVSQDFTRPIPVLNGVEVKPNEDLNPLGLYKTWRIYVKTGADGGIQFRYNGSAWGSKSFDNTPVTINDYEFAYRFLLTGSHNMKRGKEMAADQTYGIKGAQAYNTRTEKTSDDYNLELWNSMTESGDLGIKTGHDNTNGDYIELTILNAIDRFTAMYTFSSNLLSPMSEDFIRTIGEGSLSAGAERYGSFNNNNDVPAAHKDKIIDYTLSVGPYMLEAWEKNKTIVFKKNSNWNEPNRYLIQGIKLLVIDASSDSDAIYKQFNAGMLDSCGIPSKHIAEEVGKPRVYKTRGDSTFKLNVNSCTQETWNDLFGPSGKIKKGSNWEVKPWMSNDNFLNGLFYAIDRKTFAGNRGVNPSINYFADSYLNDPENGKSYNDSDAHKAAIHSYETKDSKGESTYGYSKDKAILAFSNAVKELSRSGDIELGSKSNPTEITIHVKWMYQTDVKEYGEEIAGYFESAFNDERVCGGKVKLKVVADEVSSDWQKVYNDMMAGEFDLGFGAISGNTYNPLNFLQVLKSDNESGFTLNWGTDTSKVNTKKPLIYDDKIWSFDALWATADHGGVVDNGENIKPVKKSFLDYLTLHQTDFNNGGTLYVKTNFFEDTSNTVKFDVSRISVYPFGSANVDLAFEKDANFDTCGYKVTITAAQAKAIKDEIIRVYKLEDDKKPEADRIHDPFKIDYYGVYWQIEVYYNLSIKDPKSGEWGTPSENYVACAKNESAWRD